MIWDQKWYLCDTIYPPAKRSHKILGVRFVYLRTSLLLELELPLLHHSAGSKFGHAHLLVLGSLWRERAAQFDREE